MNGQRDSIVNVNSIQNRKMVYSSLKSEETCLFSQQAPPMSNFPTLNNRLHLGNLRAHITLPCVLSYIDRVS